MRKQQNVIDVNFLAHARYVLWVSKVGGRFNLFFSASLTWKIRAAAVGVQASTFESLVYLKLFIFE